MAKLQISRNRWIALLLSAGGVVVVSAIVWRSWQPTLLANFYQQKLHQAGSDQQRSEYLAKLLQLGEPGMPAAIELLADKNELLSQQARLQLLAELQRWETLPADAASERLANLAHALAKGIDHAPQRLRNFGAELAAKILAMPAQRATSERSALLADCQRLLKASPTNGATDRTANESSTRQQSSTYAVFTTTAAEPLRLDRVARLPGGGLPIEVASVQNDVTPMNMRKNALNQSAGTNGESRGGEQAFAILGAPQRLPDSRDAQPIAAPSNRELASGLASKAASVPELNASASVELVTKLAVPADIGKLPVRDVIGMLNSADDGQCSQIQAELMRRGFTPVDLALARRLADANIQRRKELANFLPSLPGVDAKPWLMWLSRDESLEVRLAAATVMATSEDPEMLAWVRELASSDSQIAARVKLR